MERSKRWQLGPVLTPDLTESIALAEAYAGTVREKRHISEAVQSIAKISQTFPHLKRCDGRRVLLERATPELSEEGLKQLLQDKNFDLSLLLPHFEVIKVFSRPAKTQAQATEGSRLWPMNFHPDKLIENVLSGSAFSDKALESIGECMDVVVRASESARGVEECGGSCMIVDATSQQVLALSAASTNEHPMWHASMLAIDLVAHFQGRGAWDLRKEKVPVTLGKRKFDEGGALFYPESLGELGLPKALAIEPEAKRSKGKGRDSRDDRPYLCTGYWALLSEEPCSLCAMALLHSRVSKIFYARENTGFGVLGSRAILHSLAGLNHRYQVWKARKE